MLFCVVDISIICVLQAVNSYSNSILHDIVQLLWDIQVL